MKKLVLVFVAVVAMSFASCGNKAAQEAPVVDSDSIAAVVDSAAEDSAADSAVVEEVPAEEAPAAN